MDTQKFTWKQLALLCVANFVVSVVAGYIVYRITNAKDTTTATSPAALSQPSTPVVTSTPATPTTTTGTV